MKHDSGSKILMAGMLFLTLAACQKTEPTTEGRAEKIGQQIDQAASRAAVHLNKIAEEAGQGLAKAGKHVEEAAKNAQAKNEQNEAQGSTGANQ